MASWQDLDDERRAHVLELLDHRFGDGTVYLRDHEDREAHAIGQAIGLIGADGLITPSGRALVDRRRDDPGWAPAARTRARRGAA